MKDIVISGSTYKSVESIKVETVSGDIATFIDLDDGSPYELKGSSSARGMPAMVGYGYTTGDLTGLDGTSHAKEDE